MRWWSELKYLVRKLNRRRAERELQEEMAPPGDGDPGEDRRRALSGGGAVCSPAGIWQRCFGDGGQSRMVGIRLLEDLVAGPPFGRECW